MGVPPPRHSRSPSDAHFYISRTRALPPLRACQVLLIPASCEGVPDIECDLQPAPDDANRLRAPRRHPAEGEWHPPTLLLTKC